MLLELSRSWQLIAILLYQPLTFCVTWLFYVYYFVHFILWLHFWLIIGQLWDISRNFCGSQLNFQPCCQWIKPQIVLNSVLFWSANIVNFVVTSCRRFVFIVFVTLFDIFVRTCCRYQPRSAVSEFKTFFSSRICSDLCSVLVVSRGYINCHQLFSAPSTTVHLGTLEYRCLRCLHCLHWADLTESGTVRTGSKCAELW